MIHTGKYVYKGSLNKTGAVKAGSWIDSFNREPVSRMTVISYKTEMCIINVDKLNTSFVFFESEREQSVFPKYWRVNI